MLRKFLCPSLRSKSYELLSRCRTQISGPAQLEVCATQENILIFRENLIYIVIEKYLYKR